MAESSGSLELLPDLDDLFGKEACGGALPPPCSPPLLDHLFGTAVRADRIWPSRYGVVGDYIPIGFFKQQLFPFVGSTESRERSIVPPEAESWSPAVAPVGVESDTTSAHR